MPRILTAALVLACTASASAQTFAPVTPQAMPPLVTARPSLTARRFVPLSSMNRNLAIKQLTGNQAAAASETVIHFANPQTDPNGSTMFDKVTSIASNQPIVMLDAGGVARLDLNELGGQTMQGIWLFDCVAVPGSGGMAWQGKAKNASGMIGATLPAGSLNTVFAVDFRTLQSSYVLLTSADGKPWWFVGCDATLVK